jgi:hypothetical protein
MPSGRFVTVFDLAQSGFKDWGFAASGLIFVGVGAVIFVSPWLLRALRIPFREPDGWRWPLFRFGFLGFGLLWTLGSFAMTFSEYCAHLAVLTEHRCAVVEGPVEDFAPMPPEGTPTSGLGSQTSGSPIPITV